jgi:hypothetical protein
LQAQQHETERYAATLEELTRPRLSAWLSEVNARSEDEVGSKAAMLGEIRNKLGLPVPDGFILTTEAYRQYCGIPLWKEIRDATRDLDLGDLDALRRLSEELSRKAMECVLPRTVEVAITARAATLLKNGGALAVRSSARGEGGEKSYAGQFVSLLNVPLDEALDGYRRVIAGRFSERALFYRLSTGLSEVDNPMAALFLVMVPARASGIMYTRDPSDQKSKLLWVTATRGLVSKLPAAACRPTSSWCLVAGRTSSWSAMSCIRRRNLSRRKPEASAAFRFGLAPRMSLAFRTATCTRSRNGGSASKSISERRRISSGCSTRTTGFGLSSRAPS